jgi:hypothetical protein
MPQLACCMFSRTHFRSLTSSKGMIDQNCHNDELYRVFTNIITSAIMTRSFRTQSVEWSEAVALLVVSIDFPLPNVCFFQFELIWSHFEDSQRGLAWNYYRCLHSFNIQSVAIYQRIHRSSYFSIAERRERTKSKAR